MAGGGIVKLLSKLLIVTGTGGSPLIYFGSQSITSEKNREIDWTIELANEEGTKQLSGRKWKYQDVDIKKWCWPEEFGEDGKGDIYKLQLKSFTEKRNGLPKSFAFRNPFQLIKIGFTKKQGKQELQLEQKTEGIEFFKDKLHLLALKTKNSISFVPALKKIDGDYSASTIEAKLKSPATDWARAENQKIGLLKDKSDPITLVRKVNRVLADENEKGKCQTSQTWGKIVWKGWGFVEIANQKWITLDWMSIADKSAFDDKNNVDLKNNEYKHIKKKHSYYQWKMKESLEEAIAIKFEDVVISDEGIGDGKDIEIKWNGNIKPTITSKLNR